MLSETSPGYLRVGGTYTDYVLYMVPDSRTGMMPWDPTCGVPKLANGTVEPTTCPPNSYPCCLHLSTARWNETLHFAHAVGWRVAFTLNLLHGRGFPPRYGTASCVVKAAWDPSNAEALLRWTVANVPPAMWPSHLGLGNELDDCLTADQWLADLRTLQAVVDRVFPAAQRPALVAPDVAQGTLDWQRDFLEGWASEPTLANATGGAAFAYHSYHNSNGTVQFLGDAVFDPEYYAGFLYDYTAHGGLQRLAAPGLELWLTETSSSMAPAPSGQVNGVSAAPDTFWYVNALGMAAATGHHVFVKETLTGNRLETLASHYCASGTPAYHPHPSFWVAILWQRIMGRNVLTAVVEDTAGSLGGHVWAFAHRAAGAEAADGMIAMALTNGFDRAQTVQLASLSSGVGSHPSRQRQQDPRADANTAADWNVTTYVLTARDLSADVVQLNGGDLVVGPEGQLPPLKGVTSSGSGTGWPEVTLPAHSAVFVTAHSGKFTTATP